VQGFFLVASPLPLPVHIPGCQNERKAPFLPPAAMPAHTRSLYVALAEFFQKAKLRTIKPRSISGNDRRTDAEETICPLILLAFCRFLQACKGAYLFD